MYIVDIVDIIDIDLYDGVDVLPELQPRLPAVVVAQHAEAVPVPEGPVLEQPHGGEHLVELGGDVAAPDSQSEASIGVTRPIRAYLAPGLMSSSPRLCTATLASQY